MGWSYQQKPPLGWPIDWDNSITDSLVGLWLMNEGGGSTLYDLTGNANSGTITNAIFGAGKFGSCLIFDGDGDYVDLGSNIDATGDLTVSLCFKSDDISTTEVMVYIVNSGSESANYMEIGKYQSKILASADNDNADSRISSALSSNIWYHLVVTKTSAGVVNGIFVDGLDDTNAAGAQFTANSAKQLLAASYYNSAINDEFAGSIDNVSIFDRILTASEIAQLYREPFCMFKDPAEIAFFGGYQPVGNVGIMTPNTGYWGPTF